MKEFIAGIHYFIDGFKLLFKPGLKLFVLFPVLINILFFVALFFTFKHFVSIFNAWFQNYLPVWLDWIVVFFWIIFIAGFLLFFLYAFITLANIIAAPFNSLLAEKVECYLTNSKLQSSSLFDNIKDIPRVIGRQFAIIFYYLPRVIILFILFFIPIVQATAGLLWFLFNAWFMALSYVDYPTDNHRIPLTTVRERLQQKRLVALGFGVSVVVTSLIPFMNFFTIPAAVAGATKMWLQEFNPKN